MAGTFAGVLLARAGHEVTMFERTPVLAPVGAGFLLQPSGQGVLERAGLLGEAVRRAEPITHMRAVTHGGRVLVRLDYGDLLESSRAYGVRRAELHETLHGAAVTAGVTVRLGVEIVGHESVGEGVRLISAGEGACGPFDMVLAADGARSPLRQAAGVRHRAHTYAHGAAWLTGPCPAVRNHLYQVTRGTKVLCGVLPTGEGQASLFWGLPVRDFAAVRGGGFGAWRERIVGVCPEAASVLGAHDSFERVTFATCHHVHMPRWHVGRVLFLGDAAHATSPHLGQGVNLALMDAEAFATALAGAPDVPGAFAAYERARRRHVAFYSRLTYLLSPFFQSDGFVRGFARDVFLPLMPRVPYVRREMLRTLAGDKPGWLS